MVLYRGVGLAALGFWLILSAPALGGGPYLDKGDGTVVEEASGLLWQRADDGVQRNWGEAGNYCKTLQLAGYGDWMLPSAHMLEGLVDSSYSPTIDPVFGAQSSYYWSASATNPQAAKYVNFAYGNSYSYNKENRYYVRCVRQGGLGAGSDRQPPPGASGAGGGAGTPGVVGGVPTAITRNPPVVAVTPPAAPGAGVPLAAPLGELTPTAPSAGEVAGAASGGPGGEATAAAGRMGDAPGVEAPAAVEFQEVKEGPEGSPASPPSQNGAAERTETVRPTAPDQVAVGPAGGAGVGVASGNARQNQPAFLEIDASQARRPSDAPSLPQGVLAYSFVNGLKGDADWNKDGRLMAREMKAFVGVGVENLTQGSDNKPEISSLGPDFALCAEPEGSTQVLAVGIDGYADSRIGAVPMAGLSAQMVQLITGKQCKTTALDLLLGPLADRRGVVAKLAALKNTLKPADTLILYFAGAVVGQGENRLLLPQDADLDLLAFTSLRVTDLHDYLARLPVRKVILLFEAGATVSAGVGE